MTDYQNKHEMFRKDKSQVKWNPCGAKRGGEAVLDATQAIAPRLELDFWISGWRLSFIWRLFWNVPAFFQGHRAVEKYENTRI